MKKRFSLFLLVSLPVLAALLFLRLFDSELTPVHDGPAVPALVGAGELLPLATGTASVSGENDSLGASEDLAAGNPDEERDFLKEFSDWTADYLSEPSSQARMELEKAGLALVEERREVMKTLIREDPRAAIAAALPVDVRDELPWAIQSRMERIVSGRGDLGVYGVVPHADQELPDRMVLRNFKVGAANYDTFVYGRLLGQRSQEDLFLHGIAVDNLLAVDENPVRVLGAREAEERVDEFDLCENGGGEIKAETTEGFVAFCSAGHVAAYGAEAADFQVAGGAGTYGTHGEMSVIVIRVDFAQESGASVSESDAYDRMFQVDQFFREASHRQFSFRQIHVTADVLRMPKSVDDYLDPGGEVDDETGDVSEPGHRVLLEDAMAEAFEAGYVSDYDFVIVALPSIGYPWAGLGRIGGRGAWIQGAFNRGVVAHELGHNFGLWHARYWEPVGLQSVGTYPLGNARTVEYGNAFDVMGKSGNFPLNQFSGNFKNIIGWLPDDRVHQVEEDADAGTYRIYRLDGGAAFPAGTRKYSARIAVGAEGDLPQPPVKDYWIDYRQLFVDSPRAMSGVVVQWGDAQGSQQGNHLLNLSPTPWPTPPVEDAPLGLGETYVDMTNEVIITPTAKGGSGANSYVDVIVTRGQLATSIINPEQEFSADNPTGEVRIPAEGTIKLRASVTESGSGLDTLVFTFDDIELPGVVVQVAPGVYELEIPATDWGEDTFTLRSVASNMAGNVVRSQPVLVRFVEAEIVLTADPAVGLVNEPIFFTVSRIAGEGLLESAEIFVSGVSIGQTDSHLTYTWFPAVGGFFTVHATAEDEHGVVHRTPSIEVRIYSDTFPYTFDASPETITLGENVSLSVDAGADTLFFVEYWVDDDVLTEREIAPFSYDWRPTIPGTYFVRAAVASDTGHWASPIKSVTVTKPILTVFVSPRIAMPGEPFQFWASVDSPSWDVTQVEYRVDGSLYATRADFGAQPVTYFPQTSNLYQVEVIARDQYGNEAVGSVNFTTHATLNLTWTPKNSTTFDDLLAGASGGGRVIIGGQDGTLRYSDDGTTWIPASLPTAFTVRGLAYGSGVFVAVGDAGKIAISEDAEIWEARSSGLNSHLRSVRYENGLFHAVGDQGAILYSSDGNLWQLAVSPETNNTLWDTSYGLGRWVAVGQAGMILTSEDGQNWTAQVAETTIPLRGVTFGKGVFVVVGGRQTTPDIIEGIIMTSFDGVNWVKNSRSEILYSVLFSRQSFVATGNEGAILASYDGFLWRKETVGSGRWHGAVFHSDGFYAFGQSGTLRRSDLSPFPASYTEWLARHLDGIEINDTARLLPDASFDGKVINLKRYAMGFDPWTTITSEDLPHLVRISDEGQEHFGLTYRQSAHAADLLIRPETSIDLMDWNPLGAEALSDLIEHGDYEEVTVDDRFEPDSDRRFFRLNVRFIKPW